MKTIILAIAILTIAAGIAISCNEQHAANPVAVTISKDSLVKRGAYLVNMMGCNDCHSPKKVTEHGIIADPDLLLSGHPAQMPLQNLDSNTLKTGMIFNMMLTAIAGPWGVSFTANLTSDSTGIGTWSLEQFRKAFTQGKWKGLDNSRMLLPPMPWENYRNITDEDLEAIFTYLKSTKPVKNVVPAPIPPTELGKYMRKG